MHAAKDEEALGDSFELRINVEFHDVFDLFSALRDLYCLYNQKNSGNYEE